MRFYVNLPNPAIAWSDISRITEILLYYFHNIMERKKYVYLTLPVHSSPAVIIGIVSRSGLNEVYLSFVSYVVLATFLLIELSFGLLTKSQAVTVPTLVFVYITYSLLPVKLQYAVVAGTMFMLSQLILTLTMENELSNQVIFVYD